MQHFAFSSTSSGGSSGSGSTSTGGSTDDTSDDASGWLSSIGNWFVSVGNWIKEGFTNLIDNIKEFLGITNNKIDENTNSVDTGFADTQETLDTNFAGLYEDMDYATNQLVTGFENSIGGIQSVDNHFVYYADGTIKTIDQYRDDFNKYVDDEAYNNDYSNLVTENNKAGNDSADVAIGNGVNGVKEKFNFYNDISNNVKSMVDVITDVESAPKYYLNVNSKWYSGEVCIVDLSWYAPYKDLGDNVICIFVYIAFLWNIFIRLPDIINGAGASSYAGNMVSDIETYHKTGIGRSSSLRR